MKKLGIILALAMVGLLVMASAAFALVAPFTHGDFASNSKGCADCHVTHAAVGQKLLNDGNGTQTSFCLACHGNAALGSPMDVYNGKVLKDVNFDAAGRNVPVPGDWSAAGEYNPSLAGGFKESFDFGDSAAFEGVTSIHNVKGSPAEFGNTGDITNYDYVVANTIPGSTNLKIDFECGSCHDPHAGGAYLPDSATKNPRLLKEVLPKDATVRRVKMVIDQDANLPTRYTDGFNGWCGGCHDIFDTTKAGDNRTGYDKTNGRHAYMHKFGGVVDASKYKGGSSPYVVDKMPLEGIVANGKISCITCHRAHGSSAQAQPMNWDRYGEYKGYDNVTPEGDVNVIGDNAGKGSALLRLKQRDVCWNCHGAAEFNHDGTH